MSQKLELLRKTILSAQEGKSNLKIISLKGNFDCSLIEKIIENNELNKIKVKTLDNANPDYEKNQTIEVDLNDGGLIEIKLLDSI